MKKSILTIAALAAFSAATVLAQGQSAHPFDTDNSSSSTTQTTDPATLAARQVSFLTKLLTLTTGQVTQATTIFTASITAVQALQTQVTAADTALVTAIKANNTANITTQATLLGTLHGQALAIDAKADAAFYLLLTTDQKTKLDSLNDDGFFGRGFGVHIPGGH
jgi:Spy/CpxP family protein refolding chaperone